MVCENPDPQNYNGLYLFADISQNVYENKQQAKMKSLGSQNVDDNKAVICISQNVIERKEVSGSARR
jgi:hypothetical protein